jgi:hypothetical protein
MGWLSKQLNTFQNFKDPRIRNPRVFCLQKGFMTDADSKKIKQAEWSKQHILTKDQTKQLILNKFRRAEEMHLALKKREMFVQKHR